MFWFVWLCLCGACAPCPPCFWLVGGGAPVGGIVVCDSGAGLCVVQERGLSPHTPVVASQGCPPVLRSVVEVCRSVGGGVSLGVVDKQHRVCHGSGFGPWCFHSEDEQDYWGQLRMGRVFAYSEVASSLGERRGKVGRAGNR